MDEGRAELIRGMRDLADFLEDRPELPVGGAGSGTGKVALWGVVQGDSEEETREEFARLARTVGSAEKGADDFFFNLRRDFGGGVTYELSAYREVVCKRVVVGEEEVEVPDPDAPTITERREVVEWQCPDSILGASA